MQVISAWHLPLVCITSMVPSLPALGSGSCLLGLSMNFKVPCKVEMKVGIQKVVTIVHELEHKALSGRTSLCAHNHGLVTPQRWLQSPNKCLSSTSSRQVRLISFSVPDNGKIINPIGDLLHAFLIAYLYPNSARILEN
jgi:hypothetical protein